MQKTSKRCPNNTRINPKTGLCEPLKEMNKKFEEKLEEFRCKEIKALLFDEYLRETNNEKSGNQSVTKFFIKK
jgi:hypothetical protein